MRNLIFVWMMAVALGVMCGCSKVEVETETKAGAAEMVTFDIPRTLYERMWEGYEALAAKELTPDGPFDPDEALGLAACGFASNIAEIASRPRGHMAFVDDLCTDEERRELWPFCVEAFEATLESKMKIGEQGYQLIGEDGELLPRNPTVRWVNGKVEAWAIGQLDGRFKRMSAETYCKMFEEEEVPENLLAWQIDKLYYVLIESSTEGAWNPREYVFLIWDGNRSPVVVASFGSFPNAKEATAALCYHCDAASRHNLAVLEWQHRSHRQTMSPRRIEAFLKLAQEREVPTASANLKILYDHIPELRMK